MKFSIKDRQRFTRLWMANITTEEMAKVFECSAASISKAAKRLELPSRNRGRMTVVPDSLARAAKQLGKADGSDAIVNQLGVHPVTARSAMERVQSQVAPVVMAEPRRETPAVVNNVAPLHQATPEKRYSDFLGSAEQRNHFLEVKNNAVRQIVSRSRFGLTSVAVVELILGDAINRATVKG